MRVIYADDAPNLLEEVCTHLRQAGHEAVPLETDQLLDFQDRLTFMLEDGFQPDVIILGGHNQLRDTDGAPLLDLDAFSISNWLQGLRQQTALADCKLVLFTRDVELRELAHEHPEWGTAMVVAKDEQDYLANLLRVVNGS